MLEAGADGWNRWRREHEDAPVNLAGADLRGADLARRDLGGADLRDADLRDAQLGRARLVGSDLSGAQLDGVDARRCLLRGARLDGASLRHADLSMSDLRKAGLGAADLSLADLRGTRLGQASLREANLRRTNLLGCNLYRADLTGALLAETVFADTLLSEVTGLDRCRHLGPSILDHRSLVRSGGLPPAFLRGCGLPNRLVQEMPGLLGAGPAFSSCFISYAGADQEFAESLYRQLQASEVCCWFAPEDMKIGAKILDSLDEAITVQDKLLLILSRASLESDWVEDEISKAFAEERRRKTTVVLPVRIDDAVLEADRPWAMKLRDNRNIGDFSDWRDPDCFAANLRRLLRDLAVD